MFTANQVYLEGLAWLFDPANEDEAIAMSAVGT
jgi:hypothetical protein